MSIPLHNSIINFTIDTGSPASFINQKTADMLLKDPASNATFKNIKDVKIGMRFIDYNHKTINLLGALYVDVTSAGWAVDQARFLVVEKKRNLVGMDLHAKLGIKTEQIPAKY